MHEQSSADCETWRQLGRHIVRMQNGLTLVYLTLRDERELGIPLTPETARKLEGYACWASQRRLPPTLKKVLAKTWGVRGGGPILTHGIEAKR